MRVPGWFIFVSCFVSCVAAQNNKGPFLGDIAQHAVEQAKLTSVGGAPFHLKAVITETTNPDSDYKAEVEEYWLSSDKWHRTIVAPNFSQNLTVEGDRAFEESKGDYFPWWLNDLVTAIFDPLPMLDQLKELNEPIHKPAANSRVCPRLQMRVGVPPIQNSAFLVFCFGGDDGLLQSVNTPGYDAEFYDYKGFDHREVARRITIEPEPGTTIEAKITELSELKTPDPVMFQVSQITPAAERIRHVVVNDDTIRKLSLSTPELRWPTVRSGKTTGVLSIYVSVDRTGRVQETWPLNSDNAGLNDSAREQVMKWLFKPATAEGVPAQVEAILTFAFKTEIADAVPILSDEEARKLAIKTVEPVFPAGTPKGTQVRIQVGLTPEGMPNGASNPDNVPTPLFMAAYGAVRQWRFRPCVQNGKPDVCAANIIFRAR